jgi:hypothetical protein
MLEVTNEQRFENLQRHGALLLKEMKKIQDQFTDQAELPAQTMLSQRNRYVDLQQTYQFVISMQQQLFPPKIVAPGNGNGQMHKIN